VLLAASACGGKSRLVVDSEPDGLALLDDMEPDGYEDRERFSWRGERAGNWWSPSGYGQDGLVTDLVPPREGSTGACRLAGAGGATLVAVLQFPSYFSYPLAEYRGLAFHARLESASGRLVVDMHDESRFRSPAFSVSPEWERFEFSFDELSPAWSRRAASIEFRASENGEPFELWIDDVWLVCRGACPADDG
jgi:hypothetical protein